MSLVAIVGSFALAACRNDVPQILGPDTAAALHFDSLSVQASAASQANRVAALDLMVRALADGTIPSTVVLVTGPTAHDTATYNTLSWSAATLKTTATSDSVTDSLLVFVGWRGNNADTMVVVRSGHTKLAPQVQAELSTLGLTAGLGSDTLVSGALVTANTVAVADSGSVEGDFGFFGAACQYVTVTSVANDHGFQCNRELVQWHFGLRFSPSATWGLSTALSPGVVVVN